MDLEKEEKEPRKRVQDEVVSGVAEGERREQLKVWGTDEFREATSRFSDKLCSYTVAVLVRGGHSLVVSWCPRRSRPGGSAGGPS